MLLSALLSPSRHHVPRAGDDLVRKLELRRTESVAVLAKIEDLALEQSDRQSRRVHHREQETPHALRR
jgi:hypothetical protein